MVQIKDKDKMIVKKLEIVPIECVVRGYLYGSLFNRVLNGSISLPIEPILASHLPKPIFDPTTKFEKIDRPVSEEEIISKGWVTKKELSRIQGESISLYNQMAEICSKAGFILADVKFEFGRDGDEIILADSLGPDEFRLWPIDKYKPGDIQVSYDKQLVRDWLIEVGFKEKMDQHKKNGVPLPRPPELPFNLITEVSKRYMESFERISNWKLG
jgi:phosphoribosylaminoimidazole-succinocarboxamide synthase